ncbi:sensor histidine kinase KdpD [Lutibacter sp.]|uniref:sensor histidine kinase n=1 Tax=Lutibacter sp. TaxID=1925666 RepID=UPI002732BD42|nr:HAMP domain-containing sensor histidine kinase [Lutibacter sp.]MDP3312895.1 HAMP domain-containing sensor histidine kinase [Lutibacter sp.]
MNKFNYKYIVYFIAFTVVLTIGVQVYWNYKEYQVNKQHLVSKVQLSLDNSVEAYYANLTKSGIITLTSRDGKNSREKIDTIVVKTNSRRGLRKQIDSTLQNIEKSNKKKPLIISNHRGSGFPFFGSNTNFPKNIDSLISKVAISISRDTLDLKKLDSYIGKELKRNHLSINYALKYNYEQWDENDSIVKKSTEFKFENFPKNYLKTESKSTFLPHRSSLELFFINETALVLKKSLISILLSLLLSTCIIVIIFYLLKTIYKQKQLAEVKNDLINNITHEFKTPIATISTALEAMKSFNVLNDKVKTKKYIGIAHSQVDKLTMMVEKILETAALTHEELELKKIPHDIAQVLIETIEKYKLVANGKNITFINKTTNVLLQMDKFHLENAIGNVLDNALKYGGNLIQINLEQINKNIEITIDDNGNGIPKSQKDRIFEQFYRIPTGDTHNVKGFGIGLYYSKKIIENHNGTIELIYNSKNSAQFKIKLPLE